ncbi:MAG: hypothetical protein ACM3O7_00665 [Acidobacteriota bacterium]
MSAEPHPFAALFPHEPALRLRDPLAEFLGTVAPGAVIEYTFGDVVRMAGHACPTVAGAWLVTVSALRALYGAAAPVRGEITVACMGGPGQFGYGPMAQVIANITGAAPETGFRGVAGRFRRAGLLTFHPESPALRTFVFRRTDNGQGVRVTYDPDGVPGEPRLPELMSAALHGDATAGAAFRAAWTSRVAGVLAAGARLVTVEPVAGAEAGLPERSGPA